jgi:hypothetical protein
MSRKSLVLFFSLFLLATLPAVADSTVYDNGPVNGTVDAWTVNYGYAVTDSFFLSSAYTITGFQFGVWAYPGDTAVSVDYSISASPFGGTPATVALSSVFQYSNQYGYDIDLLTATGLNLPLSAGTYWLTLQNAVTTQGNPLYWDENSGPSQACESSLGTVPSESFQIIGSQNSTTCGSWCMPSPEPGTFLLLGSGMLGFGTALRRKLKP